MRYRVYKAEVFTPLLLVLCPTTACSLFVLFVNLNGNFVYQVLEGTSNRPEEEVYVIATLEPQFASSDPAVSGSWSALPGSSSVVSGSWSALSGSSSVVPGSYSAVPGPINSVSVGAMQEGPTAQTVTPEEEFQLEAIWYLEANG